MFGRLHGIQIRNGAARTEQTVARLVPANYAAHLLQRYLLDDVVDGRHLVREHVRIGGGRDPFARQRYDVQALRDLIEESRMCWQKMFIGRNIINKKFKVRERERELPVRTEYFMATSQSFKI